MTEFDKALINVMQSLPDEDAENYAFVKGYIKEKNPELWKLHQEDYIKRKQEENPAKTIPPEENTKSYQNFLENASTDLWNLCRELYQYRDIDIDWMYDRTMFLSTKLSPEQEFFIKKEYGDATTPDLNSTFNKLYNLSHELLLQIYPNIEEFLTHYIENEKITSKVIRGKINWNDTIINAAKQGTEHPITFTYVSPKTKFDTPENFLLLISIYWMINDARYLLSLDGFSIKFSSEQKNELQRIIRISEKILENTPLREISKKCYSLSKLRIDPSLHHDVRSLIRNTNLRLARNQISPRSAIRYSQLLKWIKHYISWNISRYSTMADFGRDRKEDIDTMMELWILYEVASYIDDEVGSVVPLTDKKGKLTGFSFSLFNHNIKLHWDQGFQRQSDSKTLRPDYVFQVDDDYAPIIMDSKNWNKENLRNIGIKMVYYLAELDELRVTHAIGIIPTTTKDKLPAYPNPILVGSQHPNQVKTHWRVKLVYFLPKRGFEYEEKRTVFLDEIYETLKKSIIPVPEITS